jgi:hypothetical protein
MVSLKNTQKISWATNNIRNAVATASYLHIYCGPASCHVAVHCCSHNDYRQMKVVNVQVAGNHKQNINQFLRTMSFYRMAFFRGFFILPEQSRSSFRP